MFYFLNSLDATFKSRLIRIKSRGNLRFNWGKCGCLFDRKHIILFPETGYHLWNIRLQKFSKKSQKYVFQFSWQLLLPNKSAFTLCFIVNSPDVVIFVIFGLGVLNSLYNKTASMLVLFFGLGIIFLAFFLPFVNLGVYFRWFTRKRVLLFFGHVDWISPFDFCRKCQLILFGQSFILFLPDKTLACTSRNLVHGYF